ncbi:MAG TPA: hypothetical protein VM869_24675 [Enhygromyxa sp.]|nr:hypothetical protein [Enhygromyxa sp.]
MNWTDALLRRTWAAAALLSFSSFACADDGNGEGNNDAAETSGDGDGDPGDGDGDPGDGDGDPGDGDGEPGDGDPGDGDGEPGDGDGEPGDGDGDGDGEPGDGDGEPGDGDGDGDGDGEPIMCPAVFPTFDKSCSDVEQCAIAIHTTDCCGNSVALGINVDEVADFDAAEAICDSQYPACGCPAGPTLAEDGQQVLDPMSLAVDCIEGSCSTFVE